MANFCLRIRFLWLPALINVQFSENVTQISVAKIMRNFALFCERFSVVKRSMFFYVPKVLIRKPIKLIFEAFFFVKIICDVSDTDLGADEESDAVAQDTDCAEQQERAASLPQTRREHVEQRRVCRRHQSELQKHMTRSESSLIQ